MIAIETRYLPPTNYRGRRIVATSPNGHRLVMSDPDCDRSEDSHRAAAQALCDKMGWGWKIIGGGTKAGMVWVFAE